MEIDLFIYVENESNRGLTNTRVGYVLGASVKGVYSKRRHSLSVVDCNCNRAVLEGLNDAMQRIKGADHTLNIKCPSWYVVNTLQKGDYLKWLKTGHRNSRGKEVAHMDMWMKITPMLMKKCAGKVRAYYEKNSVLKDGIK